ncbi:XdhC family protein [Pseudemcibacter aquimaris]|uniref:XdhC family protein n=1 Tax=Pseudemcibacter aquimaris TaxID=2857064 RepID=UPI0020113758|nr:XdhC family protein [Pseudemcibacter aquimaris]MCC3860508.1 XdhC family protein [Pseudemcibacter aquimaris]WDU59333.1 XdhC family protein [Pseudemcibacter aquimaris]
MSTDWRHIWETIRDWDNEGRKMALATVVKTWGSSPRPVGSHLVIDADGHMEGSVSGGCVDGVVVTTAFDVIKSGEGELLKFEVATDQAWEVGLSCGGEVHIIVEPLIDVQKTCAFLLDGDPHEVRTLKSTIKTADDELFIHEFKPALQMIVVGAVHISQGLVKMAEALDIDVTLIDPRTAYASEERFPGTKFMTDWPDEAIEKIGINSSTAIVTLSHDPKLDDPALEMAMRSDAFYIAALGSRKTQKQRRDRMREKGFTEEEIDRVHGPAGLDIGSLEPAEIALSILAELVSIRRAENIKGIA